MKFKTLAAACLTLATALPALAQDAPGATRADKRQARQQARINQGQATGALTPKEATRLEAGQQHVENVEAQATADGKVTKKERARIEHAQDVQSKRIAKQKHDRQHDRNHDGAKDPHRPKQ